MAHDVTVLGSLDLDLYVVRAVVAGALAVEAAGARASVPTADQVRARLAR